MPAFGRQLVKAALETLELLLSRGGRRGHHFGIPCERFQFGSFPVIPKNVLGHAITVVRGLVSISLHASVKAPGYHIQRAIGQLLRTRITAPSFKEQREFPVQSLILLTRALAVGIEPDKQRIQRFGVEVGPLRSVQR